MTRSEVQALSDEKVIKHAFGPQGWQASWIAIDELARRALANEQLLDTACAAIGRDRAIGVHYVPYGSYAAVGRILESGNDRAIRHLLREMDGWTAHEQEDAISPWAGHKRLKEGTRELMVRYGWSPKYFETVQGS